MRSPRRSALFALALLGSAGIGAWWLVASRDDETLTVIDTATGEQRTVDLPIDDPRLSQRGPFVVAVGDDDETAVLIDTRDGTTTEFGQLGDLDRASQIVWFRTGGQPLLLGGFLEGFVLDPESGQRFVLPAASRFAWQPSPVAVSADAAVFTLMSVDEDLLVDLATGEGEVVDGRVVALSDGVVITSSDTGVEFAARDGRWSRSAPDDLDPWSSIPSGDSVVYVATDGNVMVQGPGDEAGQSAGLLAEVGRPRMVSVVEPRRVVVSTPSGTSLVDPAAGAMTDIGEPGQQLPLTAWSAAGRAELAWECIPLIGDDRVSFVDPESGDVLGTADLPAGTLAAGSDELDVFELRTLLTSDGCALASTVGEAWVLATAGGSASGAGEVVWLADDGSAVIVRRGHDRNLVTLSDSDNAEEVDEYTVFADAATGSTLAW